MSQHAGVLRRVQAAVLADVRTVRTPTVRQHHRPRYQAAEAHLHHLRLGEGLLCAGYFLFYFIFYYAQVKLFSVRIIYWRINTEYLVEDL